ncbi:MAG: hypothetical protein GXX85_17705 [Ignavibacteria bacterium]|nr:hypothetical protein [Ignavibacteria bacterium]
MKEEIKDLSLEQIFETGYYSLSNCEDTELNQFATELTEKEKFEIVLEAIIPLIQKYSVEELIEFRNNQINKLNAIIPQINNINKKRKLAKIKFKDLQETLDITINDITTEIVNLLRYVYELNLLNGIKEKDKEGFNALVEANRLLRNEIPETGNNPFPKRKQKAGNKRQYSKEEFLKELDKIPESYKKTATSIGKFFGRNESFVRENFEYHFNMTVREYYKNSQ